MGWQNRSSRVERLRWGVRAVRTGDRPWAGSSWTFGGARVLSVNDSPGRPALSLGPRALCAGSRKLVQALEFSELRLQSIGPAGEGLRRDAGGDGADNARGRHELQHFLVATAEGSGGHVVGEWSCRAAS